MPFYELYKKGHHSRNLGHFASIVNIAAVDGKILEDEFLMLKRLAAKLEIDNTEFDEVLKNPEKYPINLSYSADERLERMHDFFDMMFADHEIDTKEIVLIKRYAIGLGYNSVNANLLIKESIAIYSGKIDLEEYKFILNKRLSSK